MIKNDLNKSVRSKEVSGLVYEIQKWISEGPNQFEKLTTGKMFIQNLKVWE